MDRPRRARRRHAFLLVLALAAPSLAQQPVSEDAGPMRQDSLPLREVPRSVHDGGGTIGEADQSTRRSRSVRDATTRGMLSGPVSSISSGSMRDANAPRQGGSVAEASAGAVKHDSDQPLGTRISQPVRELGPLQQHLRQVREQGTAAAMAAAGAPAAAPPSE